MEKIEFLAGTEEKFKEFMGNLSASDKIALVSHTDHDGVAAAKVASEVVKYDVLKFVDYSELNEDLVKELDMKGVNKIIMTDLGIDDVNVIQSMSIFADVLIIDHHLFKEDVNSDKITFMNAKDYCATYLVYYLFSKIKNIEELDWLVACASLADWMYFKNTEFMTKTYEKYGEVFSDDKIEVKKTKFWDVQFKIVLSTFYFEDNLLNVFEGIGKEFGELTGIEENIGEVQKDIDDTLKRFENEKEIYGDVYLWEFSSKFNIKSIVATLLSSKEQDKTLIIMSKHGKTYGISARRQDKTVNLPEFLEKLLKGFEHSASGGHIPAAGASFLARDLPEFKKRLKSLE